MDTIALIIVDSTRLYHNSPSSLSHVLCRKAQALYLWPMPLFYTSIIRTRQPTLVQLHLSSPSLNPFLCTTFPMMYRSRSQSTKHIQKHAVRLLGVDIQRIRDLAAPSCLGLVPNLTPSFLCALLFFLYLGLVISLFYLGFHRSERNAADLSKKCRHRVLHPSEYFKPALSNSMSCSVVIF